MFEKAEIIAALLFGAGGGVLGHGLSYWQTRKRIPAEVDSIIVDGAEKSVQAALAVATAEAARADRAEAQVRERDERIDALLSKIDALQAALDAVRAELNQIREEHSK